MKRAIAISLVVACAAGTAHVSRPRARLLEKCDRMIEAVDEQLRCALPPDLRGSVVQWRNEMQTRLDGTRLQAGNMTPEQLAEAERVCADTLRAIEREPVCGGAK